MKTLKITNPKTGALLRELPVTPLDQIPELHRRAVAVQKSWAALSLKKRARKLLDLREVLINQCDEVVSLIASENGKPEFEALIHDVIGSVEHLTYLGGQGFHVLKDQKLHLSNPILLGKVSVLQRSPLGVVTVISPWNFPFFLPFVEIIAAVLAGNAVLFKPSEVTPLIGLKIVSLFGDAGFPEGLVTPVIGDGSAGAAIIDARPAKIFFTGSVETGKRIMAQASTQLIPVNLELGGKDPMIVLKDADIDLATSAAVWGSMANSGQICASTERLIVHESIAEEFKSKLLEKLSTLRPGKDLGVATFEKQKLVYEAQLTDARTRGLKLEPQGAGEFDSHHKALHPTLVSGDGIEGSAIYKDETFGPVVAMTTFTSLQDAAKKANHSRYGLLASVIGRDLGIAESVARELEAGTVLINDVLYTASIPETPWGGMKDSGFGKKHSAEGLLEFVHTRHIHRPRFSFLSKKALWWFPYTDHQAAFFRDYLELHRRSKWARLKALPDLLWNFVRLLKSEPRL